MFCTPLKNNFCVQMFHTQGRTGAKMTTGQGGRQGRHCKFLLIPPSLSLPRVKSMFSVRRNGV